MNSMLQCLGQTGEMASIFLHMKNPSSSQGLVRAYCDLMQQMWSASASECSSRYMTNSLYPRALKDAFCKKNPQFSGFNQHDSQEFMQFLLSSLHEELKKPPKTKPDIPQNEDPEEWWRWYKVLETSNLFDVFVGQLCSSLTCHNCKHTSLTFDPFWELSVSLPKPSSNHHYSSTYSTFYGTSSSSVQLHECLDVFTRKEELTGCERPYCERCQSEQECSKKMTIQRLPQVLVIHLKRFSSYGRRSKLDTSVKIPHTLDLSRYTSSGGAVGGRQSAAQELPGTVYELYAVSNHSGTVYFGHYTAWCKHYSTNKWYSYNDSNVSPVTVQSPTFSSSTAYVLFYRQMKKNKVTKI
jgi:ubiquitin carboxyl-terminal hydrolase 2/21